MADVSDALQMLVGKIELAHSEHGSGGLRLDAAYDASDFIREHGAALAQALENDARYRWLFDGAGDDVCIRAQGASPTHPHLYIYWKCVDKTKVDEFIDSAIAAQQKEAANGD